MEKRRRARINKCLEELKVLVPDLTESGTRVDKADVLEMTVEHLTRMKNKRRNLTSNLSPHGKNILQIPSFIFHFNFHLDSIFLLVDSNCILRPDKIL